MSAKSTARHKQNEQKIAEHSVRLKKEQAEAQAQAEKESKTLKLPKMNLNRMVSNGGMAKGAGHAAKTVGKKVAATATNPTKLAIGLAKIAGLPGTGLIVKDDGHGHGHGHGHGQLDKMEDADHIMTQAKKHFLEEITEITMLFNCFTLGYYCLHCGPVIIPINFHNSVFQAIGAHGVILFPAFFLMVFLQPLTTKYSCMLDNVLFKDQETIAEVYHSLSGLIFLKNQITAQLMKVGSGLAHDQGIDDIEINVANISTLIFNSIDKSGDGRLEHAELRSGLSSFGVYLSKKEFKSIKSFVDPDLDGFIEMREWTSFLTSTDEQLQHGEWDPEKKIMGARTRLSGQLVRKAMSMEGFGGADGLTRSTGIDELAAMIFTAMDEDKSDSLSSRRSLLVLTHLLSN